VNGVTADRAGVSSTKPFFQTGLVEPMSAGRYLEHGIGRLIL
jgi:hypothetical protein